MDFLQENNCISLLLNLVGSRSNLIPEKSNDDPLKSNQTSNDEVNRNRNLLDSAESYEEWQTAAINLDKLLGYESWKQEPNTDIYDFELIKLRTEQLKECRVSGDLEQLLFLVRTTLERNLGNMGDPRLYAVSYTGTKTIIEDYISECEQCLAKLLEAGDDETCSLTTTRILDTLVQTRKAFGCTALVLSGGSVLGIIHTGVMRELLRQKLLPRIISGSSAGSIFASVLCVHFDYEIEELFNTLIEEKFDIFEETGNEESVFVRLARFFKHGTILDNKYLAETMQSLLGNLSFQEAYNRTRKILNVTVSPASIYESARLLNYLTAPNVLIWSAVCASCSVPFVFSSYTLLAKDVVTGEVYPWSPSSLKYIDGSVDNDLPLIRLSELFNVDHFIACQVNPHVVPFMKQNVLSELTKFSRFFQQTQNVLTEEFSHYLLVASELGILKNISSKLRSLLTQQYTGDITILPDVKVSELKDLFKNPTKATFLDALMRGQKSTWPQLALIRNHCAIELCLDKTIHKLRGKMIPQQRRVSGKALGLKNFYSSVNIKALGNTSKLPICRHNSTSVTTNTPLWLLSTASTKVVSSSHNHHYRHKSETFQVKRKSSQDLSSMFNIDSPTRRMSPSVSRKNSFKSINKMFDSIAGAVTKTAMAAQSPEPPRAIQFTLTSSLRETSQGPSRSRRTSITEKCELLE
jgi:TAG lipase/steryl ester hydrolase/phospholipase A2/LPA acyltransferase